MIWLVCFAYPMALACCAGVLLALSKRRYRGGSLAKGFAYTAMALVDMLFVLPCLSEDPRMPLYDFISPIVFNAGMLCLLCSCRLPARALSRLGKFAVVLSLFLTVWVCQSGDYKAHAYEVTAVTSPDGRYRAILMSFAKDDDYRLLLKSESPLNAWRGADEIGRLTSTDCLLTWKDDHTLLIRPTADDSLNYSDLGGSRGKDVRVRFGTHVLKPTGKAASDQP